MGIFVKQYNVKNLCDTPDKNRHVNVIFYMQHLYFTFVMLIGTQTLLCINIEPNVPHITTVIKRFESI